MRFSRIAAALAALAALLGAVALAAPAAASGPPCTASICVYKLVSTTPGPLAASLSTNGVALAAPNTAVAGARLELRNYSPTRTFEQFALDPTTKELSLAGTDLCVTGFAHEVVLEPCSAPSVWASQSWTFSLGGMFTNGKKLNMFVTGVAAYTPVTDSGTSFATWAANLALTPA